METSWDGGDSGDLMAGWLVKSPPLDNKKPIFKPVTPKWRRRWFVLRDTLPGQYILNYYTDSTARKLKGTIDLDQCFQVDSGLTYNSGKVALANLFNITTPKRIYYLSADTVEEMNGWVQSLCQACGLRPYQLEEGEQEEDQEKPAEGQDNSGLGEEMINNTSSQTPISGPYMHLSECFTGGNHPSSHVRKTGASSEVGNPPLTSRSSQLTSLASTSLTADDSLNIGDDSVFLPNSPQSKACREDDLSLQFSNLQTGGMVPPHRPPKPAGLRTFTAPQTQNGGDNYENLQNAQKILQQSQRLESNNNNNPCTTTLPSSRSHTTGFSSTVGRQMPPPSVDRRLKPGMRTPGESVTLPSGGFQGRKFSHDLESLTNLMEPVAARGMVHVPGQSESRFGTLDRTCSIESFHSRKNSEEEETIYFYMPSIQNSHQDGGRWDPLMIPCQDMIGQSVEYLDLDLPNPPNSAEQQAKENKEAEHPGTVYKTVDFIKTEAFNRTKKNVEEKRYNIQK